MPTNKKLIIKSFVILILILSTTSIIYWLNIKQPSHCEKDPKSVGCVYERVKNNRDYSLCKTLGSYGAADDLCYKYVAVSSGDLTGCKMMRETVFQSECFMDIAVKKGDQSICSLIKNKNWQMDCVAIGRLSKNDPSICKAASKSKDSRWNCYEKIAEAKRDISICVNIEREDLKMACYRKVAVYNSLIFNSDCNKILTKDDRDLCYASLMICRMIENKEEKDKCFLDKVKGDKAFLRTCIEAHEGGCEVEGGYVGIHTFKKYLELLGLCNNISLGTMRLKCLNLVVENASLSLKMLTFLLIIIIVTIPIFVHLIWKRRLYSGEGWRQYKVVVNDDLINLADKYNTTWKILAKVNRIKKPYTLKPGQIILVPDLSKQKNKKL